MKSSRLRFLLLNSLLDFIFLVTGFLIFTWVYPGTLNSLIPSLIQPFLWASAMWLAVSVISGKYLDIEHKSLNQIVAGVFVPDFTMLILWFLYIWIFSVTRKTAIIGIGTGAIAFFLEFLWVLYGYSRLQYKREIGKFGFMKPILYPDVLDPNREQEDRVKPAEAEDEKYGFRKIPSFPRLAYPEQSVLTLLGGKVLADQPEILEFLKKNLPLDIIDKHKVQIINTRTVFNLIGVDESSQQMIINFQRINNIRRINQFLIQVNKNLLPGGFFLVCAQTKEERKELFMKRIPPPFNWILYPADFLFKRVFPKLPFFKEIYFLITRGENRILSLTEILGRLYYCGFEKLQKAHSHGNHFFLVKKIGEPRSDANPSYGPFVKMMRVGQYGRIIPVYKIRTMHPYSEYIQEYVYQQLKLDETGKFNNDFRITTWGRIFRKLWIDELPQLLNLYRGQLKIVGVRALSKHYFSLYPPELQHMRTRVKPGIIPPFYVDKPQSFEEICESERKYIEAYFKKPFLTDWKYFWGAMYNILIKRARSR